MMSAWESSAELPLAYQGLPPSHRIASAAERDCGSDRENSATASSMHAGLPGSSSWQSLYPQPSADDSGAVATPPLHRCRMRRGRGRSQRLQRHGSSRLQALLAVVQQSLKAEQPALQARGMASRGTRSHATGAQLASASSSPSDSDTTAALSAPDWAASFAAQYRQQVLHALLRGMMPHHAADLLQAKQFLAQFACPSGR